MTLEEWIHDTETILNEKEILWEHSIDPWEKRFQQEQMKLYQQKLGFLRELQDYRIKYGQNLA